MIRGVWAAVSHLLQIQEDSSGVPSLEVALYTPLCRVFRYWSSHILQSFKSPWRDRQTDRQREGWIGRHRQSVREAVDDDNAHKSLSMRSIREHEEKTAISDRSKV